MRKGYPAEQAMQTRLGRVTVKVTGVRSESDEPVTLRSVRVPPYVRKTSTLETALPGLWVGPEAKGL